MKKKPLINLGVDVYEDVLDNNLRVFVIPKKSVNNIYVTFSTKYGSIENEFVPIGESKMIKVPDGIAHFLEHKAFEQKDGTDPFTFFSERGADANANTTYYKTTYLFSGINFFEENIKYLIEYVTTPYFTDENVEKEKGIIEQEIKMYLDDPYTRLFEGLLYNAFVKHPIRHSIIGSVESINKITKEDLYKCYNTFYRPSNMFIVVTGNVDPENVMAILKSIKFDDKKDVDDIKVKKYVEPDEVYKEKEILKLNVTIPKATINYKINTKNIKDMPYRRIYYYLSILFDSKLGTTSALSERLKKEGIINSDIEISTVDTIDHLLFTVFCETKNYDEFIDNVNKELSDLTISEKELNRKKKILIGSNLYMSDNIFSLNSKVMNNIIKYNEVIYDNHNEINNLNIKEMNKLIKSISLKNKNIFIIEPKD